MTRTNLSLNAEQLASMFTQLKTLEMAGLPAFQGFEILAKSDAKLKQPLALMRQQLKSGRTISEAGFRAGIFNSTIRTLIQAAEISGSLAEIYGRLASHYQGSSARIKKIKSRLTFPILTLVLSLFIQPLPALVSSEISGAVYLQQTVGRIFVMGMGVLLLVSLPKILRNLGVETSWHRLQLRVYPVAKWVINRQINNFFFILAIMLEAGLPFSEAFSCAVMTIENSCLREQFCPALVVAGNGASVADTLAKVPSINDAMIHIVSSGEQSGKLASSILHFTRMETENIRLQDDALAEWLPRIIYSVIAIWLTYSILGS